MTALAQAGGNNLPGEIYTCEGNREENQDVLKKEHCVGLLLCCCVSWIVDLIVIVPSERKTL